MSKQLRVGVVGLGIWGRNHAALYSNYHRSELSVVCDTDAERAKVLAAKFGCAWTTDVREAARQCDAIAVATPDFAHTEVALAAIAAGKHILIEKPLATTTKEAMQIWQAAEAAGIVGMVDFHLRWSPDYLMISDAIRRGDLGALYMAYIRISNAMEVAQQWLPWSHRSGPEWFLLPHILDLMVWILEEMPKSVFARGAKNVVGGSRRDCLDALQASFQFERAFVTVETSWAVPSSVPWVVDADFALYGSKGRVHFKPADRNLNIAADRYYWPVSGDEPDRYGRLSHWIYDSMRYWIDSCLGLVPLTSTIADGVRNTVLVESVLQAIAERREVIITLPKLESQRRPAAV
ncbi:MAG TPA: Gfo/Idh/MocA family oxidoreductase, partial [Steroidobacteraceae bacterium]|nr:Gfo/Idh/MocA family oxidoreductase [Steroidobacteraceae bacterium]